jgi:hypothetical protein
LNKTNARGFQWLVSFFVVFRRSPGKHKNAFFLDEPNLPAWTQAADFRKTISRLARKSDLVHHTFAFLVGPDELDLVRVVEMKDRRVGTKVLTSITASDPAGLLPLQEALGYDLAQSLFAQQRNLVLEGLTDYWYVDALGHLLREAGMADLNEKIALVPAASAGKARLLRNNPLCAKTESGRTVGFRRGGRPSGEAGYVDSHPGNKRILRTKDAYCGPVTTPEIEDLLRTTLVAVAKADPA